MNRDEFIQQYILSRTSHKLTIQELCEDAKFAWDFIYPEHQHFKIVKERA